MPVPRHVWMSFTMQGDDGGPLVWKGPAGDVAVGVTTMFTGCGFNGPSVYADVAAASNWIRNAIQVHVD